MLILTACNFTKGWLTNLFEGFLSQNAELTLPDSAYRLLKFL